MKSIAVVPAILALLLSAVRAAAVVDPDPDQLGIYFDTSAETVCSDQQVGVPFFAYLAVTNPTADALHGIRFTMCTGTTAPASLLFVLVDWPVNPNINPVETDWCAVGWSTPFTAPIIPNAGVAVVASLQYLMLAPQEIRFYLGPFGDVPGAMPAYQAPDGSWVPLGVSSGDPALPVAAVNACGVVGTETLGFGQVKSLYR